ncbi:hypothetical protein C440_12644 [Haloferax mucosum ATCC BAA-1512]|uniref:DUF7129 domain-containing protein n=1 Tax=Haloferax mucosum ATCC BAA-1512 TaxID=662479 RepID=M0IAU6_9EURY|nr:rubrerythrin-like domain-containing protein [Haloferax mucosum]ELZ92968.1 hypothetical protein C440_12644 [Haloferax mucosum ATCC BAA-1512]
MTEQADTRASGRLVEAESRALVGPEPTALVERPTAELVGPKPTELVERPPAELMTRRTDALTTRRTDALVTAEPTALVARSRFECGVCGTRSASSTHEQACPRCGGALERLGASNE